MTAPVGELERALEAIAPILDVPLAVTCAECGALSEVEFDVVRFFSGGARAGARVALPEIHRLAAACRWAHRSCRFRQPEARSRRARRGRARRVAEGGELLGRLAQRATATPLHAASAPHGGFLVAPAIPSRSPLVEADQRLNLDPLLQAGLASEASVLGNEGPSASTSIGARPTSRRPRRHGRCPRVNAWALLVRPTLASRPLSRTPLGDPPILPRSGRRARRPGSGSIRTGRRRAARLCPPNPSPFRRPPSSRSRSEGRMGSERPVAVAVGKALCPRAGRCAHSGSGGGLRGVRQSPFAFTGACVAALVARQGGRLGSDRNLALPGRSL